MGLYENEGRKPASPDTHDATDEAESGESKKAGQNEAQNTRKTKLGWVKGVHVPVSLNILGVIMFLRLNWYVEMGTTSK